MTNAPLRRGALPVEELLTHYGDMSLRAFCDMAIEQGLMPLPFSMTHEQPFIVASETERYPQVYTSADVSVQRELTA